jgi:hypothetical protein
MVWAGCVSVPEESLEVQELRRQRRAEAAVPIDARVAQAGRMLFGDFYEERLGLVATFVVERGGRIEKGPVHVEQNAHLLIGLACHFAVTGDPAIEERARRLLDGFDELDRLNGFDGYLPLEARVIDGNVEVINNRFVASSYVQLLYAEVIALRLFSDPSLKAAIRTQAVRLLDYLKDHDLVVMDEHGVPLEYSDASLKPRIMGMSSELETLMFVEAGVFFTRDDPVRAEAWAALKKRMDGEFKYDRLPFVLHFSTPILELPTISSSWLNLMKLAGLVETNGSAKYRRLLRGLADDYRAHQNPFFIALDLLHGPRKCAGRSSDELRLAWSRLETYPLTNTSHELNNLGRPPYRLQWPPRFIKNAWAYQAVEPVPFYDYAGDRYLWKRNLRLLRGNPGGEGGERYSAVDFYEAYWMLSYAKHAGLTGR